MDDKPKYTPGPWEVNTYGGYHSVEQCGPVCISICNIESDRPLADARLIAAAPALYEAARDALRNVENVIRAVEALGLDAGHLNVMADRLHIALALAEKGGA